MDRDVSMDGDDRVSVGSSLGDGRISVATLMLYCCWNLLRANEFTLFTSRDIYNGFANHNDSTKGEMMTDLKTTNTMVDDVWVDLNMAE